MNNNDEKFFACPHCKGLIKESEARREQRKIIEGKGQKIESGFVCKHCEKLFDSDTVFYFCEKHQKRYGYEKRNDWVGKQLDYCSECKSEKEGEFKKQLRQRFIDHFKKLDTSNFAKGKWNHCRQNFVSKEEFINHLENCSQNLSSLSLQQIRTANCQKCNKITTYDNYFEQDHPHKCKESNQDVNSLTNLLNQIKQYLRANDIKEIFLTDQGELIITHNDLRQQITQANNQQLQQLKSYLQTKPNKKITLEEIEKLEKQEQVKSNKLGTGTIITISVVATLTIIGLGYLILRKFSKKKE